MLESIFRGTFRCTRVVSVPETTQQGIAVFTPRDSGCVDYKEQGFYDLNGQTFTYYQHQCFKIEKKTLSIMRYNGSLLHMFEYPSTLRLPYAFHHTHPCRKDQYALTLTIQSVDAFETFYTISGPTKNYTMHTVFVRQ
jgi:hypothetical protein